MDAIARLKSHLRGPPRVSQKAFAKLCGVSQGTVSKLISGVQYIPPYRAIARVNELLGTSFDDWLMSANRKGRRTSKAGKRSKAA